MKITTKIRPRVLRLLLVSAAITACLVIAACGSSTSSSTTTTSTSASSTTPKSGATTSRTSLEECLKEQGITPPAHIPGNGTGTRPAGTPPAGAGGGAGGKSNLQAAFKACGATGHFGGGASGTAKSSS